MKSRVLYIFLLFSALLLVAPASWAQKTFISIYADGNLITSGEASEPNYLEGAFDLSNYADVISYNFQMSRGLTDGVPSGSITVSPITIVKPRGPSSIHLLRALAMNQIITASITFFLPDPADPGKSMQAFQINMSNGRVASIKPWQNITPSSTAMLESISIFFYSIEWEHPPTSVLFEYSPLTSG